MGFRSAGQALPVPSTASGICQRTIPRRIIPLTAGGITTELWAGGDPQHHGVLWDLSRAGACLLTHSAVEFLRGSRFELVLRPAIGIAEMRIPVATCWSQPDGSQTFLGVHFYEGLLHSGTFLDRLLEGTGARAMRPFGARAA
ncbi:MULTISPECIES: PilZ domain-containing protein [Aphanothece]|uniref:PilZ domain-containing protein n=1 Tax=Aphanothece TaxID=1121 RepID=UPI003984725D